MSLSIVLQCGLLPLLIKFCRLGVGHFFKQNCPKLLSFNKVNNLVWYSIMIKYGFVAVGHGHSEGTRANISDLDFYRDDLLQHIDIVKQVHPNVPLFILGHSMVSMQFYFLKFGWCILTYRSIFVGFSLR